jgi:para-aminobenzoate synthetase/4-amino-4-deoxychorismate lyase
MLKLPPQSVVIQDHLTGVPQWLIFRNPVASISSSRIEDVMQCLQEVEAQTARGLHAAGFISYEASPAMDPAMVTHAPRGVPLIWFGLYDRREILTLSYSHTKALELDAWRPSVSLSDYRECIEQAKQRIRNGDTYQVNYTLRLRSDFDGDPWALFLELYKAQRSSYSAYINLGRYHICSVSPELFFSLNQGELTCKPMKGTAKRGNTMAEDGESEQWLISSPKNRAENVMIVDMIRNDMGRIAETGSVRVERLFAVEKYPTVLQMTSTVTSRTSAPISDVFRSMFPCASITGAPKIKTMQIIKQLEPDPRGIYTGSIGYISPGANSQFNVAIRTAVVDTEEKSAEYGVGSGIVWESEADDEYEECQTKARVLFYRDPEFDLLESVLWSPELGFYLLEQHLERLQESAAYFQFNLVAQQLEQELQEFARSARELRAKIRITVSRCGKVSVKSSPLVSIGQSKLGVANRAIRPSAFLCHKTTYRKPYTELLDEQRALQPDLDDLILWNEAGYITESSIANVVVADRGEFFTPASNQCLLPGVFRKCLLQRGIIREKDIRLDELVNSQAVFLINSVRGWMPLDKFSLDHTWVVRSDFSYETPRL